MNTEATCPCGCYVRGVKLFDRKHWVISEVIDHGAGQYYRYTTRGVNLNCAVGGYGYDISWRVPTLDGLDYDLSGASWTFATKAA